MIKELKEVREALRGETWECYVCKQHIHNNETRFEMIPDCPWMHEDCADFIAKKTNYTMVKQLDFVEKYITGVKAAEKLNAVIERLEGEELVEEVAKMLHVQESGDKADWENDAFEYTKEAYREEVRIVINAITGGGDD